VQIIFAYFAQMMAVLAQFRLFSGGKKDLLKNASDAHLMAICVSKQKICVKILFINSLYHWKRGYYHFSHNTEEKSKKYYLCGGP
jgi:hypothetical protein